MDEWVVANTLKKIIVNVLSAKSSSLEARPAQRPFGLAEDIWANAVRARPTSTGTLFCYRGARRFSYYTFARCSKANAAQVGLNPAFFSTHSLRVAGASALAAAGVPNYVPSLHAYNDAMTAMCNITTLTVSDLRRTTPAV